MMITITTTTPYRAPVVDAIDSVPRLDELVRVLEATEAADVSPDIIVDDRGIVIPIHWENHHIPFLLTSPLTYQADVLLGVVFDALDNHEQARDYLKEHSALLMELTVRHYLRENMPLSETLAQALSPVATHESQYRLHHNVALLQQYGLWPASVSLAEVQARFQQALSVAPDDEHHAFTLKQYAGLLLDSQQAEEAETLLQQHIPKTLSQAASYALKSLLVSAQMSQLAVPYDSSRLDTLKHLLWETLTYFEQQQQLTEAGLLLMDASELANISESYSESLGYVNRALTIFQTEDLPELVATSLLRKGVLLYTWAQNGNPQFYKPAIDAYQEALKVFKRDETPDTFAQIHLHLGVLYAEMAALQHKKSIWAAVSATSFQEALRYYTREDFPYEYGLTCNNYANALTKYPTALRSDNYEKALEYFTRALEVRTTHYPYERAITLLNFLEASWHVKNESDRFNQARYEDMLQKAQEVKKLVEAPDLQSEADRHLEQLRVLKQTTNSEGYA